MADSTQEWTVVQGAIAHDAGSETEAFALAAELDATTGSRPPVEVKTRWVSEWLPADTSSPLCQGEEEPEPSVAEMVAEFHQAFGIAIGVPESEGLRALRASLLAEEAEEALDALEFESLEGVAKEHADVVIVAYGTALTFGIDLDEAIRRVHASNMTKLDADEQPVLRADGKVLKSDRYVAPSMLGIAGAGLLATTPQTQPADVKEEWAIRLGGEGGGIYNCPSRDSAEYQLELFADRSPEVVRRVVTYGRFAPVAPAADVTPDADGVTSPTKKEGGQ